MKFSKILALAAAVVVSFSSMAANAVTVTPTSQWASTLIGFSSEWNSGPWGAHQALGEPNTFGYGDIQTSWAPSPANGTFEYITLGFETPVYSVAALVRETWGNGFVYQIDAIDIGGVYHKVWEGEDNSPTGIPFNFTASWSQTSYLTTGLKIYVDTNNQPSWEEIDAVALYGFPESPVPEPTSMVLGLMSVAGLLGSRKRR